MQADMISPQSPTDNYLDGLNTPQMTAVEALDGPVLVLAGAGTGKTRVLTTRLAHLIRSNKAWPSQILAVTFTNKAAGEMKERVMGLVPEAGDNGWWIGTFHSLAARLLRQNAELVGLTSSFTIITPDDAQRLLKQIGEAMGVDVKKNPPKLMSAIIDRWKDKAITPDMLKPDDIGQAVQGRMGQIYKQYQQRLRELNACDFGDLMLHCITIWKNPANKDILENLQRKFQYILVDEYQDTNVAQYQWLRLLAIAHNNICCVGDDDQSIYGWRGAEVGNILRFEKDYENSITVRLEQNYRSTGHILRAASHVIAKNQGRLGKTLWSEGGNGEQITVRGVWDAPSEAKYISTTIEDLRLNKNRQLKDFAILVRAGFQTREFEERFLKVGMPYRVVGGLRFYERAEIRDALAYLRIVTQPNDDLAFERIINTPKRGVGTTSVQKLHMDARANGTSLMHVLKPMLDSGEVKGKAHTSLTALMHSLTRWSTMINSTPPADLAELILEESGYIEMWKNEKTPDAPGRVENLKELISAISQFDTLGAFLEHVALVMDTQDNSDGNQVTIMTLHGAKGLEFPVVFCAGWEEGVFPSQRSIDENGQVGLEEERRLAYVGITRARQKLYITHAANRQIYGQWTSSTPSRFIGEMPEETVDMQREHGMNMRFGDNSQAPSPVRSIPVSTVCRTPSPAQRTGRPITPPKDTAPKENANGFVVGGQVSHPKFGTGTIFHMDGNKLDIKFSSGVKRILDNFVSPVS